MHLLDELLINCVMIGLEGCACCNVVMHWSMKKELSAYRVGTVSEGIVSSVHPIDSFNRPGLTQQPKR